MPRLNSNESLFTTKLKEILEDEQAKSIIQWGENKYSIQINDQKLFLSNILPKYFRHNRLQSFVRQMNLYGFKKMRSSEIHCFINMQLKNGKKLTDLKSKNEIKRERLWNSRESELQSNKISAQNQRKYHEIKNEKEISKFLQNKCNFSPLEHFQKAQQQLFKQYQDAIFYHQLYTFSVQQCNQANNLATLLYHYP